MRINHLLGTVGMIATVACGSESGGSVTEPTNRPSNSISIVPGAETRGTTAFSPNPLSLSLASGGQVRWHNDDEVPAGGEYGGSTGTSHNIVADDFSFSSGIIVPRATFLHTFQQVGDYGYHCSIHPTMRGTISVTP